MYSHRRTNDVHLEIVLSGPEESSFRQGGRETHVTAIFRELQYEPAQGHSRPNCIQDRLLPRSARFRNGQSLRPVAVEVSGEIFHMKIRCSRAHAGLSQTRHDLTAMRHNEWCLRQ